MGVSLRTLAVCFLLFPNALLVRISFLLSTVTLGTYTIGIAQTGIMYSSYQSGPKLLIYEADKNPPDASAT